MPIEARCTLLLLLGLLAPLAAMQFDENGVSQRIRELIAEISKRQEGDGHWDYSSYPVGCTALCLLALKEAGVANNDPTVQAATNFIFQTPSSRTYSEGLVPCAMELVDPVATRDRLVQALTYLVESQNSNGYWSYGPSRSGGDASNSQFAILGLGAARRCGYVIPEETRLAALNYWYENQNEDGGWGYSPKSGSQFQWTCAGIASLHLLGERFLHRPECCGPLRVNQAMQRGLDYLAERLSGGGAVSRPYHLYAMERVGMFLGLERIGGVDWYQAGANAFMRLGLRGSTPDLAFQLLFLAKGNKPIAIAKWHWDPGLPAAYQADVDAWVETAGKELGQRYDAISVRLGDRASDDDLMRASCLFLTGRGLFQLDAQAVTSLRAFLKAKGTLVIESRCDDPAFIRSVQAELLSKLYPGGQGWFEPVQADHPICNAHHQLTPDVFQAVSMALGCQRVNVVIVGKSFTCDLVDPQAAEFDRQRSQLAATNLLAWSLQNRQALRKSQRAEPIAATPTDIDLASLISEVQRRQREAATIQRLDFPLGRLVHRGEWNADPKVFAHLAQELAGHTELIQLQQELAIDPRDPELHHLVAAYLSGHTAPNLEDDEIDGLRSWLERGGLLLVNNICGCDRFDAGVHVLARQLFPDSRLEVLDDQQSIWRGPFDLTDSEPQLTQAAAEQHGADWGPVLGLRHQGRWVLLYTPISVSADLHGFLNDRIPAYHADSGLKLLTNLLHYAVTP